MNTSEKIPGPIMDTAEQLGLIELFSALSREERLKLQAIVTEDSFRANQVIMREGDIGDKLYMIVRGDVEILKHTAFGDEYTCDYLCEQLHLCFGEFSLLDGGRRSATVRAASDVTALVLHRASFMRFCDANEIIGYKIMKALALRLCARLRKADEDIVTLFEALVEEIGTL